MHCFSVLFTRKDKGPSKDDRIRVSPNPDSRDVFDVFFQCPELRHSRKFTATSSGVLRYVEDALVSMRHDTDPFERIQVLTSIHPSVMYHVCDMDDSDVRRLILNMLEDSLRYDVREV